MFPSPCFVAPSGSPRGGRVNTARMPCGRLGKPASSPKAMLSLAPERMQMLTSPLRGPAQAAMSSGITKSFVDCANVRLFFQYTFIKPLLQPSPGLGIALESRVSNANEHCSLQVTTFFFFQVKFTLQKNQPGSREPFGGILSTPKTERFQLLCQAPGPFRLFSKRSVECCFKVLFPLFSLAHLGS